MSIQAVAWVLSQPAEDLPGTARLVLIALANHADHTSGHCWPSVETIAREAGCGERTVRRYLYALKRNGFVDARQGNRRNGQFRSNDYWMIFDRTPAPWRFYSEDTGEEAPDIHEDEPAANLTAGQDGPEQDDRRPLESSGPAVTAGLRHIMLEPSDSEPSEPVGYSGGAQPVESVPAAPPSPPKPPVPAPRGFDPNARSRELERLKAAEEARKSTERIFVHEGTRAWLAWQKTKPLGYPCHQFTIGGKLCRGWYFPTLFPDSTGPPESTLLTPEDDRFIRKQVG